MHNYIIKTFWGLFNTLANVSNGQFEKGGYMVQNYYVCMYVSFES